MARNFFSKIVFILLITNITRPRSSSQLIIRKVLYYVRTNHRGIVTWCLQFSRKWNEQPHFQTAKAINRGILFCFWQAGAVVLSSCNSLLCCNAASERSMKIPAGFLEKLWAHQKERVLLKVIWFEGPILFFQFLPDEVRRTSVVEAVQKNHSRNVNSSTHEFLFPLDKRTKTNIKKAYFACWRNDCWFIKPLTCCVGDHSYDNDFNCQLIN